MLGPLGKLDVKWWREFLPTWPGTSYFTPPVEAKAQSRALVTDACLTGMGAVLGRKWIYLQWDNDWLGRAMATGDGSTSVPFLELAAVVIAVKSWIHELKHKRIVVYSDCSAVVAGINASYSPREGMMTLLRDLVALSIRHSFTITAVHVPGELNVVADLISRFDIQEAHQQFPWLLPDPSPVKVSAC